MVVSFNVSVSTSNRSSNGKRKALQYYSNKSIKKNRDFEIGAQLFSSLDKLVNSISKISGCTSSFMDKKLFSIEEVMVEFHSIDEVVFAVNCIILLLNISWLEVGGKCGQHLELKKENFNG